MSERLFAPSVNVSEMKLKLNGTLQYIAIIFSIKKHLHKASDPLLHVDKSIKMRRKRMGQK